MEHFSEISSSGHKLPGAKQANSDNSPNGKICKKWCPKGVPFSALGHHFWLRPFILPLSPKNGTENGFTICAMSNPTNNSKWHYTIATLIEVHRKRDKKGIWQKIKMASHHGTNNAIFCQNVTVHYQKRAMTRVILA